jgi:hypothetical protein
VKRILILVEGQTEERFVKDVLAPEFFPRNTFFEPRLLVTKLVKHGTSFRGGVTTYGKFRNDVQRTLAGAKGTLVTTLVDYYGLPADFPGMSTRSSTSARNRVLQVERSIREDFGDPRNFEPFLALHEYEAWLFSSRDELPRTMTAAQKEPEFAAICDSFSSPEDINEGVDTAPSKRIQRVFPAYKKTVHGPLAARRIGIDRIRSQCPHFSAWYEKLEAFAAG